MTRKIAIALLFAALASACGRSQSAQRKDENYQVVQEGQASGVTSTINAPGETPPPMTNTAVDTTTNLTMLDNPAPMGTQTAPNTVAGTLPPATTTRVQPPPMSSATMPARPRPQPQQPIQPPRTDTTVTQAPPPPTDTTATQAPPPTDTTKTDTQPPPKTDTTSTEKPPV